MHTMINGNNIYLKRFFGWFRRNTDDDSNDDEIDGDIINTEQILENEVTFTLCCQHLISIGSNSIYYRNGAL